MKLRKRVGEDRARRPAQVIRAMQARQLYARLMTLLLLGASMPTWAGESSDLPIEDLRDSRWRTASAVDTGQGVVQYLGDAAVPNGIPALIQRQLSAVEWLRSDSKVQLKTADIRVSVPNVSLKGARVISNSQAVATIGTLASFPIWTLLSSFEKNKSASAVFCVSVDGKDYLGNNARLFRYGADEELAGAIDVAVKTLVMNMRARRTTDSVACEAGIEGGQPPNQ